MEIQKNEIIIGGGGIAEAVSEVLDIKMYTTKDLQQIKPILSLAKPLDTIIITFGYLKKKPFIDLTQDEILNTISANFTMVVMALNLAKEHLKKGCTLVLFSSSTSYINTEEYSVYSACKTAIEELAKSLYKEGLDVRIVRPSRTDTKLRWDNIDDTPINRKNLLSPYDIAKEMRTFLNSNYNKLNLYKKDEIFIKEVEKW